MEEQEALVGIVDIISSKSNEESTCKNCNQTIIKKDPFFRGETWYHKCINPVGLNHFTFHTVNDDVKKCYSPEPIVEKAQQSIDKVSND